MSDIVERLREVAGMSGDNECLAIEAADEIQRLRAALLKCRDMVGHPDNIAFIDAALSIGDRRE